MRTIVAIRLEAADLRALRAGRSITVPICRECQGLGQLVVLIDAERG